MSLPLIDVLNWDTGNWASALDFWERHGGLLGGGSLDCLEIGANQGGLSVWLASHGHRVLCSDLSGTEQLAHTLVERHAMSHRVTYEDINATAIPYENRFDVIIFKSVLGGIGHGDAIDRQRQAINAMYRALRPGGRLLFAENLVGSGMHKYFRAKFTEWGSRWRYVTIAEMLAFLRDFSDVKWSTAGVLGTFGRSEKQRQLLAAIDHAGLNTLTPPAWRYIIYGVATK